MQSIITTAALLITMFTSFAADSTKGTNEIVNKVEAGSTIRSAFNRDFQNGRMLSVQARKDFTIVTFKMNEIILSAFYADNGDLIAVTRNILSTQLPISLQMNLKNNYSNYWITDCIEYNGAEQNSYYISLENADQKITLKSNPDNTWSTYEKADKK